METEKDKVRYVLPPSVRRSLKNKSRADRKFFDNLIIGIWCECRRGAEHVKSKRWEDWADDELPCYSGGQGAVFDDELDMSFNTARNKLSRKELEAVQRFIDTHTFADITDAKRQIAEDFTDSCMAAALNIVAEAFYTPARRALEAYIYGNGPMPEGIGKLTSINNQTERV